MLDILVCGRNGAATNFSGIQFMGAVRRPKATKMQLVPEVVIVSIKSMCMVALFCPSRKRWGGVTSLHHAWGRLFLICLGFTPA